MRTRIAVLGAVAGLLLTAATATSASAGPQILCPIDELSVPEYSRGVLGSTWLEPGQSLTVTGDGSIWAGVWGTGWNGPEGWHNTSADASYPAPGHRVYGLIGRLGKESYRRVGYGPVTFTNHTTHLRKKVVLRTNDNVPGNGSGAFSATVAYPCTGG